MFYNNEQETARGARKVNTRRDSNRRPCKTSNKEYNNIKETLENNNRSNEGVYKKMAEIEDRLNFVEEASVLFSDQDIPAIGTKVKIYF